MKRFALLIAFIGNSLLGLSQEHYRSFISLIGESPLTAHATELEKIGRGWNEESPILAIEILSLLRSEELIDKLEQLLEEKTGQKNLTTNEWFSWWWSQENTVSESYLEFKAQLYRLIDPRFEEYFKDRQDLTLIDPSEIRWGGVQQDGIPPLREPIMVKPSRATYLADNHEVFGVYINGEARAYPKRILGWHEMFTDQIGGIDIAGVYCTLCGTMIAYNTQGYELGTSGFLYRSNKLMYDVNTQSLWSTLEGKPVVGPLIEDYVELDYFPVVTTTWGEWKRLHPSTLVLSLNTGFTRDYDEGKAYEEYFGTDELMFSVKHADDRLKNKTEVFVMKMLEEKVALSVKYLNKKRIAYEQIGDLNLVILTDKSGANRAYEVEGQPFWRYKNSTLLDNDGNEWKVNEEQITNGSTGYMRIPGFRAFWFGWHSAHPDTRLVK